MIDRLRDCAPPPHDLLHADQAQNTDTRQLSAHANELQLRASLIYGHSTPPNVTAVMMERERDCAPVPHDLVHVDQALYSDTAQSTGQGEVLHMRLSSRYGHAYPPWASCRMTDRERL